MTFEQEAAQFATCPTCGRPRVLHGYIGTLAVCVCLGGFEIPANYREAVGKLAEHPPIVRMFKREHRRFHYWPAFDGDSGSREYAR